MAKYVFFISTEPYKYQAVDTLVEIGKATLRKGNEISGIFFFGTGVYNLKKEISCGTSIRNIPENAAALIFGIGPIIGVFGSLIGGYLGSRFGDKKYLFLALSGLAVFVTTLAYAPLVGFMILSFLVYSWFFASMWPASISLVSTLTPESGRGMAYSIFFLVPGTLGAVSPIIGALIIEGFGVLSIFPFVLALFLASSVTVLLIKDSK